MIDFETLRDLYERERSIYLKSHKHPVNILLHQVTVSLEWFSMFVLLAALNPLVSFSVALGTALYVSICSTAFNARLVGLWTLVVAECASTLVSSSMVSSRAEAAVLAVVLQAISWALQVPVGHWLIEKNNPSMAKHFTLNSVVLSLLLSFDTARDRLNVV
jgi:uncharacterized membrane protein YGL010W